MSHVIKTLPEIVGPAKAQCDLVSAEEAAAIKAQAPDTLIIDVREPAEVEKLKTEGSVNIPRGVLEMKIGEVATSADQPILIHCATGGRAALSAVALANMGYTNVRVIDADCESVAACLHC